MKPRFQTVTREATATEEKELGFIGFMLVSSANRNNSARAESEQSQSRVRIHQDKSGCCCCDITVRDRVFNVLCGLSSLNREGGKRTARQASGKWCLCFSHMTKINQFGLKPNWSMKGSGADAHPTVLHPAADGWGGTGWKNTFRVDNPATNVSVSSGCKY